MTSLWCQQSCCARKIRRILVKHKSRPHRQSTRTLKQKETQEGLGSKKRGKGSLYLSVSSEGQGVATLPRGVHRATVRLVESVSLANTSGLLANGGEATVLSVLHRWGADPVDARVTADRLVFWVNQNDFIVFVGSVL